MSSFESQTRKASFYTRRQVRTIEHTWVPMSDGCNLAARIWLPDDAKKEPVPAILTGIPYRKNDVTAVRDSRTYPYLASHGYAGVRMDLRGTGDSEGVMTDEYAPQEQRDLVESIAWISSQPWCTGAVGMTGISWGGFNSLQVAAQHPPALKAVISLCSSVDRYSDDVHYMGGCVLGSDMLSWSSTMLAYNARPPDPRLVGERWREMWLERLERATPFVETWLSHQKRDDYWKQGSVCENYENIKCPVYMVSGWADAYRNSVFRFLYGYRGPRKGLIGPWAHISPESGVPGPSIGFLQETLRWWDYWLKGIDTGIMKEPMLRAWMQEAVRPQTFYSERPGRWVTEPAWPADKTQPQLYQLGDYSLEESEQPPRELLFRGVQATGLYAGSWDPFGQPTDLPPDQRIEDGLSMSFTSPPLPNRTEILGFPKALLTLTTDRPNCLVAARLCDVWPDGASTLISRGILNLAHHSSHEKPDPLTPGKKYRAEIQMNAVAYAIPRDHRLRLALSTNYWPWVWPSPEVATIRLFTEESRLEIPVREPQETDGALPDFGPPETALPITDQVLAKGVNDRIVSRDLATGETKLVVQLDYSHGKRRLPDGIEFDEHGRDVFTIREDTPLSAFTSSEWWVSVARGSWRIRVETSSNMSSDATSFHVTNAMNAYENEAKVCSKTWTKMIPRNSV